MKKRHVGEQVARAPLQAESGVPVAEICRAQREVLHGQCALRLQSRDQGAEDSRDYGGNLVGYRANCRLANVEVVLRRNR